MSSLAETVRINVTRDLGRRLQEQRSCEGLTLAQLAAKTAIPTGELEQIEAGEVIPELSTLKAIAVALRCPQSALIFYRNLAVCARGGWS